VSTGMPGVSIDPLSVDGLFEQLRARILDGELAEGTVLSQVKLAEQFGVHRSALREALRMLQREGLIDAQYNRRVRVSGLSTADLEQLYAERIVMESLGVRATVRSMTAEDDDVLRSLLDRMNALASSDTYLAWEDVHHAFHERLVAGAGARLVTRIDHLGAYARRYRQALSAMNGAASDGFAQGALEHTALVDACAARAGESAGALMARHLARTALTLLSVREPTHDPVLVREALRMIEQTTPA
jgi:DNA-binding GntR family transcriptional regulator